MSRRRQHGQHGSAIVFALMCIILVGALAAATFNRTSFTEQRSGTARQKDRAELAADASLQMAIRAVQRTGSANTDESGPNGTGTADDRCSPIDGPVRPSGDGACPTDANRPDADPLRSDNKGYINGINSSDGLYSYVIRGGGVADNSATTNVDERLVREITAYGYYNGKSAKRTLRFLIVPRAFKFGIYSGTRTGNGIVVGSGGRLLLPPTYARKTTDPRGTDISSNGNLQFASGSRVNVRSSNTALYDKFFLAEGTSPSTSLATYFNGAPWGDIFRVSGTSITYDGYTSGGTNPETRDPDFPTSDGQINFDGNVIVTQYSDLPTYNTDDTSTSKPLGYFKSVAATNGRNAAYAAIAGNHPTSSVFTPAEFQAILDQASATIDLDGMVYVDNKNADGPCTLTFRAQQTTINNGGLLVRGCDVEVRADASLDITHGLRTAGSNTNRLPGLMVLRSNSSTLTGTTYGGNITVRTTKTNGDIPLSTELQGIVYADRNIRVAPTKDMLDPDRPNFSVNGAVIAGGSFSLSPTGSSGSGSAVVRWNPLVQRMIFSTAQGEMGTYSIRTADRPPPNIPQVTIDNASKPDNPATNSFAHFTWTTSGDVDTIECAMIGQGRSAADRAYKPCSSLASGVGEAYADYNGFQPYNQYQFKVRVCNVSGCDVDQYTWKLNPVLPTVTITTTPPNPQTGADHVANGSLFEWATTSGVDSMECSMDGAAFSSCGTVNPVTHTPSDMNETYKNLTRGTSHTFRVRVCNPTGCDQKAYTWSIPNIPPSAVTFTKKPANPTTNPSDATTLSHSFAWRASGDAATAASCKFDNAAAVPCSTLETDVETLSTCSDHTITVTLSNSGGSASASYTWHNNCRAPTISIRSSPGPYAYSAGTGYYSTTNAASCSGTTTWTGATVYSVPCTSWSMRNKPKGTGTWSVCAKNADNTAQACASSNWDRVFNIDVILNYDYDSPPCCWNGLYPESYGWAGSWGNADGGAYHTAPNSVSMQSYNDGTESTWAKIGHVAWTARGDTVTFAGVPQHYAGQTELGAGRARLQYWTGSNWVDYAFIDWPTMRHGWYWVAYCLNNQSYAGYWTRYVIEATSLYGTDVNAFGRGGAGYYFDSFGSNDTYQGTGVC